MKKALVAVLVVASVVVWRWRSHPAAQAPAEIADPNSALTVDRIWLDKVPQSERDKFNLFVLLDEESIGVFQNASVWQGNYEGFRFEANGNEVRMMFPQSGTKEKVTALATRCDEDGMDYCLVLKNSSHGVKKYYSRKGWEIERGHGNAREQIDSIVHRLVAPAS